MATNFIQDGKHIALTAPYQRNTGLGAQVGSIFGVALQTVANGVEGQFATEGVWYLAKLSTDEWAQGDKVYWDNTNKRCDTDPTVGMLIGVATAAAANPSASGYVRLNGVAPSTSEGPQAAIVALTDSTGGSGTHDDTLADGLTAVALTGTLTGTANGAMVDVAASAGACAGGAEPSAAQVDAAIATAVATIVSGVNEQLKELQTTVNLCVTDLGVQNQNDSDLAQKILEIRTALIAAGILTA